MKKNLKNEKGIMATYVAISVISFTLILTAIFSQTNAIRENQIKTMIKIKEVYEKDNQNAYQIYEQLKQNKQATEQLMASINFSKTTAQVNETITATIILMGKSVDTQNCKWVYTTQNSLYGVEDAVWGSANGCTANFETTNLTVNTAGTYYLHILLQDDSGNKSETISNEFVTVQ